MKSLLSLVIVLLTSLANASEHPNILFVVTGDWNCAIGPYGNQEVVTANLDRLVARGLVFERAYCQQAVCNPSRSSFLTGLRPNTVKVDDLRKSFRETTAAVVVQRLSVVLQCGPCAQCITTPIAT